MAVTFTSQEISDKYDRFARRYDWLESLPDLLGVSRLRQRILQRTVLEVAVGTGKNLAYYPRDSRVIAVDLSNEMLNIARKRAAKLAIHVSFLLADAEALPFRGQSFDTVLSSLSTCTFPDPFDALKEMRRVCRPEGRIRLLEHGRSDREWLGHFQDRNADQFAKPLGCHWNREPLELVRAAGLHVIETQRVFFGIFHQIEAALRKARRE